jgi:hypothetical protein
MKNIKKRVIGKVADVLSYPKRTLYDAKRASSERLADSMLALKERRANYKKEWLRLHK